MKTRLLIIIGIVATLVISLSLVYYQEIQLTLGLVQTDFEPTPLLKIDDKYYIEPKRKAQLEAVELDLRNKILQLHQKNSLGSFAVNLDYLTKEIVVIVENEQFNSEIEEMISQYPDDIPIVFSNGKIEITDFSEPEPEPEGATEDEKNLRDARQKLREVYSLNSSFGPFNIKDVIVGYGIAGDVLVVDVLTEYYESDHLDLIKQKIQDIVGPKVTIEFSPSGAIVPTSIESVFPYVWNSFLHRNGIEFTPKEQTYANNDEGYDERNRVCSPIVAANGTEFYISSTFIHEPFEITGTFVDKIKPDDCYKIWKTDAILVEPDRILMLWLENYHRNN